MILAENSRSLQNSTKPKLQLGTNRCLCASCGHYFGGAYAFEKHRVGPAGDRACLPPGAVRDKQKRSVLWLNKYGYWVRIDKPVQLQRPVVRVAA